MTFAVKNKENSIWSDQKRKAILKTNFSTAGPDQKKADDTNRLETLALRKRERGKTRNRASPALTFLFPALKEATKP